MKRTLKTLVLCFLLCLQTAAGKVNVPETFFYRKALPTMPNFVSRERSGFSEDLQQDLQHYHIVDHTNEKIKNLEINGEHNEEIINKQLARLLRQQKLLLISTTLIIFLFSTIPMLLVYFNKRKNLQTRMWEQNNAETKAESVRIQLNQLTEERSRIAQEMHDDLGTTLSSTLMGIELLNMKQNDTEALTIINASTHKLTEQINEIIWNLNIENDDLASLSDYLYRFSKDFLKLANIELIWDEENIEANKIPVQGFFRRSVYLCFKELINNVVKHAGATEVIVRFNYTNEHLFLLVKDNGCGIEKNRINRGGNGIANLGKSIMKINGNIYWVNSNGTEVHISIKL